jgi:hypothetical protein
MPRDPLRLIAAAEAAGYLDIPREDIERVLAERGVERYAEDETGSLWLSGDVERVAAESRHSGGRGAPEPPT